MRQHYRHKVLFFVSLFMLQSFLPTSTAICAGSSSAVLSALLPLHAGEDCSELQLRGLQQLAALRSVVSEVNNQLKAQDGLTIGLLVQDTCSSPDGAMKAALRTLVDIQQSCTNPPLYLGMIGPEDAESLAKVKGVSRVFNATHVLPFFHSVSKESEEDTVFYVSIERIKEQAQSLLTIVKKLNWQTFSLAFEEPMSELAEVLIQSVKEDSTVCIKGSISRMNVQAPVANLFSGNQDGVVVLTDSHLMAARVLHSYQALTKPMILLVRTVGLETWQIPRSATKMFLLQQVSTMTENVPDTMNATLKAQYEAQKQAEFQNIHCKDITNVADCAMESNTQDNLLENIDVSVTAMAHGVRLVGSALRTVHRARCLSGNSAVFGMCPKLLALPAGEWRAALRRATTTKPPDNTRVRFLMEMPTNFRVYSRDNNEGNLVMIASLTAGVLKEVAGGYVFPVMQHAVNITSCGDAPKIPVVPPQLAAAPHPPAPTPAVAYEDGPTLKDLYTSEYSFYELLGMICGVGFIMFGVMVVIIYLIYNNLVDKVEKESTGGSVESVPSRVARSSTRGRASRAARGLRDTFRRNSSVRSSTHS